MTTCTICRTPTAGRDDDDAAWCAWCFDAYVAWSEERPLGLTRWPQARARLPAPEPVWVRVWGADGEGRETHG